ncbi:RPII140-upstream gene protein isoform X1 [Glossina fuscipes]|uniref:Complex I assembly factor TIMMDC1, mitochondrial n=2 Tax=Glossina fuscipes TaxID=7396 RepID=A0A8U0WIF0_9MUSC|nr:RPII140-upstream gene protein isoform X1 [Glossina fuscipes]
MAFLRPIRRLLWIGVLPMEVDDDAVSKNTKTYKSFIERPPSNESGYDRVKDIFKIDEFGTISAELNSVYQAGFLGFLVGAIYGGIVQSRAAYMNFMENNQATAFKSHLDAKRKLQNEFTVSFAKGGFKWGWRVALFTTSYCGIVTMISVYRGKSSLYEYLTAGLISGALYKVNMGLKGMVAGGIIGGALGSLGGVASLLLMSMSGTTMEEVRYWQYKWKEYRDEAVVEAYKMAEEKEEPTPDLVKAHDSKVGDKITLESVE